MASKIGGCSVQSFFDKLEPLGFVIDQSAKNKIAEENQKPAFIISLKSEEINELDVRPVLANGNDPLNVILEKLKTIKPGEVLKIINSFEPTPLIGLLENKGFKSYVDIINNNTVETYFYRANDQEINFSKPINNSTEGWDEALKRFTGNIQVMDVRQLEMPLPMTKILAALENLPLSMALFVHHKRIPVFLLPELIDRKFDFRIKEISNNEVQLLIYKS